MRGQRDPFTGRVLTGDDGRLLACPCGCGDCPGDCGTITCISLDLADVVACPDLTQTVAGTERPLWNTSGDPNTSYDLAACPVGCQFVASVCGQIGYSIGYDIEISTDFLTLATVPKHFQNKWINFSASVSSRTLGTRLRFTTAPAVGDVYVADIRGDSISHTAVSTSAATEIAAIVALINAKSSGSVWHIWEAVDKSAESPPAVLLRPRASTTVAGVDVISTVPSWKKNSSNQAQGSGQAFVFLTVSAVAAGNSIACTHDVCTTVLGPPSFSPPNNGDPIVFQSSALFEACPTGNIALNNDCGVVDGSGHLYGQNVFYNASDASADLDGGTTVTTANGYGPTCDSSLNRWGTGGTANIALHRSDDDYDCADASVIDDAGANCVSLSISGALFKDISYEQSAFSFNDPEFTPSSPDGTYTLSKSEYSCADFEHCAPGAVHVKAYRGPDHTSPIESTKDMDLYFYVGFRAGLWQVYFLADNGSFDPFYGTYSEFGYLYAFSSQRWIAYVSDCELGTAVPIYDEYGQQNGTVTLSIAHATGESGCPAYDGDCTPVDDGGDNSSSSSSSSTPSSNSSSSSSRSSASSPSSNSSSSSSTVNESASSSSFDDVTCCVLTDGTTWANDSWLIAQQTIVASSWPAACFDPSGNNLAEHVPFADCFAPDSVDYTGSDSSILATYTSGSGWAATFPLPVIGAPFGPCHLGTITSDTGNVISQNDQYGYYSSRTVHYSSGAAYTITRSVQVINNRCADDHSSTSSVAMLGMHLNDREFTMLHDPQPKFDGPTGVANHPRRPAGNTVSTTASTPKRKPCGACSRKRPK